MKMSGEEIIAASRETVWKALNDPHVLKQSIPGCESITKHSDTQMEARVTVKIGPVKAGFTGTVKLSDLNPPNSYRISGEGKGIAGLANGGADVRLEDADGGGTRLSYDVDAQVGATGDAGRSDALQRPVRHDRGSPGRVAGGYDLQDGAGWRVWLYRAAEIGKGADVCGGSAHARLPHERSRSAKTARCGGFQ